MTRLIPSSASIQEPSWDTTEAEPATVNATVYKRLKQDIVACELAPNTRLRFDELRKRYAVSVSSLREALSRLVIEGLVVEESHKGVRVAAFKVDDLRDLMRTRRIMEVEVMKSAIANGDARWEANILAAFHMYESMLKAGADSPDLRDDRVARHQGFHSALVAACDSPRLLWLRTILQAQAQRYLTFAFRSVSVDVQTVLGEHEQIMRAAIERRTSLACALVEEHLEQAVTRAMPVIEAFAAGSQGKGSF